MKSVVHLNRSYTADALQECEKRMECLKLSLETHPCSAKEAIANAELFKEYVFELENPKFVESDK